MVLNQILSIIQDKFTMRKDSKFREFIVEKLNRNYNETYTIMKLIFSFSTKIGDYGGGRYTKDDKTDHVLELKSSMEEMILVNMK